ncbi:transcription elongation factor GreA [Candidatus Gribaldobacteria bacterium]|nr:transcription elongation factor GreA [Candidatus Gribaldobacteria bacterium]
MVKCFTKQGLAKLKQELDRLKKVERRKLAEEIAKATAFGDLSENAAYKDAKEKKAFLEGRILELETILANAQVLEKKQSDKVCLGSQITLEADQQTMILTLVSPQEADFDKGLVSLESPLGKAIFNQKQGDEVKVNDKIYKIKAIG